MMRQAPAFRMGDSMETEDQKLTRLRHIAGKRRLDIIRAPIDYVEPDRGWRVIETFHSSHSKQQIVFGGPKRGRGATLDEIEAYLKANPP
jgi:hypothetical protein